MIIAALQRPNCCPPIYETVATPVPTTIADVTTMTAHLTSLWVYNSSTGPLTLNLKDRQSTPISLPNDNFEIAPGNTVYIGCPSGLLAVNGFSIGASGTGLVFGATWF